MSWGGDENDADGASQNDQRPCGLQEIGEANGGGGGPRDRSAEVQHNAENQGSVYSGSVNRRGWGGTL
jgi:hypothetical protein